MMVNQAENSPALSVAGRQAAPAQTGFAARLRSGGIEPGDSEELRLNKSLLLFATGLVCIVMMVWVAIYYLLGANLSRDLALGVQLLLVGNVLLYIRTQHFDSFRTTQLGLFLFLPFVAQWAAGNLIECCSTTSSSKSARSRKGWRNPAHRSGLPRTPRIIFSSPRSSEARRSGSLRA
jgi:hypothetical protein